MTLNTELRETAHGELKWFSLKNLEKQEIIPSYLWLIQNKLNARIGVKMAVMKDEEGKLTSFKI